MIWIGAVVAGATAAVIPLVALGAVKLLSVDEERHKKKLQWLYAILTGLSIVVANNFLSPLAQRWYAAHQLETSLPETYPVFAAVRDYEPEAFAAFIAAGKKAMTAGEPLEHVQASMRAQLAPMLQQRLRVAEDDLVHSYLKVVAQEVRELHAGGDEACYSMLFPGTGAPVDMGRRLSRETAEADMRHMVALIKSAKTSPQPPVSIEQVEQDFAVVVAALVTRYGDEVGMLDAPQHTVAEKRRFCEISVSMMDEIGRLPPTQGGRVFRALNSAGASR